MTASTSTPTIRLRDPRDPSEVAELVAWDVQVVHGVEVTTFLLRTREPVHFLHVGPPAHATANVVTILDRQHAQRRYAALPARMMTTADAFR